MTRVAGGQLQGDRLDLGPLEDDGLRLETVIVVGLAWREERK